MSTLALLLTVAALVLLALAAAGVSARRVVARLARHVLLAIGATLR